MSDCSEYSSEKYFLWSYTSPPWISSLIAEAILLVGQPEKVVLLVYRWLSSYDFEPEKAVIYAKSIKDINALPLILSSYDFWEDARSTGILSSYLIIYHSWPATLWLISWSSPLKCQGAKVWPISSPASKTQIVNIQQLFSKHRITQLSWQTSMGWKCFPPLVWQSSQQAPPREEVVPMERISIVFQPVITLGFLYHRGYRDILCFNLSILEYLYHWRRRFRNSGRRRQLRRRRRRCKRCWEADKTWRRPWPAQIEGRLLIAEVKNQIPLQKFTLDMAD